MFMHTRTAKRPRRLFGNNGVGLPDKFFQIPGGRKIRTIEGVEALKYYFRVRTVEKNRQIVSALYGKLSKVFSSVP